MKQRQHVENRGRRCSVEGCNSKARVKGLCMSHYTKHKKLRVTRFQSSAGRSR